jgi:hypothetical protein
LWGFLWRLKGLGGFKKGANVNASGNGVGSVAFLWSVLPFNPTDIGRAQRQKPFAKTLHVLASCVIVVAPKVNSWGAFNDLPKRFIGGVAGSAVGSNSGDADRPKSVGALFAFNDDHKLSALKSMDAIERQVSDFQVALRFAPIGVSPNEGLLSITLNAFVQRDQSAVGVADFKSDAALKVLLGS